MSMSLQSLSLDNEPTFFRGRTTLTIFVSFDMQIEFVFTPLFGPKFISGRLSTVDLLFIRKLKFTNALLQTGQTNGNSLA